MSKKMEVSWLKLSGLILVFIMLSACHRDTPPKVETKTYYCQQLAHRMHDITWKQPNPDSYLSSLDQQRLQREWLYHDCANILR